MRRAATKGAADLFVIAKEPLPGRVKTRLCPPCSVEQAARIAEGALRDTLLAATGCGARRRVLWLDGRPGRWLPPGIEVHRQGPGSLGDRLARAFETAGGPCFLIGMDTPQVTPGLLAGALAASSTSDAVVGLTSDGGYWGIGMRSPDARVFAGVPMSSARTGAAQVERLGALGLRVQMLPELRDVDFMDDALTVALQAPDGDFARAVLSARPDMATASS